MSTFGDGFLAYHFDIYVEDSAFEYVKEIVKNRQVEFRKAMVSWKSEERLGHTLTSSILPRT